LTSFFSVLCSGLDNISPGIKFPLDMGGERCDKGINLGVALRGSEAAVTETISDKPDGGRRQRRP
jgi:hypothetical protein